MEQKNSGVLFKPIDPKEWIMGSNSPIQKRVLLDSGDWRDYIPQGEQQRWDKMESMACVSFSALNCLEILFKFFYKTEINFSDRFLAKKSDTTKRGNYLETVAETIRKDGVCPESEWPVPPMPFTWEKYYEKLSNNSLLLAWNIGKKYQFHHEWVRDKDFRDTLKFGPVQVVIELGKYLHAVVLVGYEGENPIIYDSYKLWLKTIDKSMLIRSYGKQFTFKDLFSMPMQLNDNWIYQLVEGPGGWAVALDGRLIVDDLAKLLATHIRRNKGDIVGKGGELTLAQWQSYPKINLKGESV
jgi:hypothetical protein